MEEKIRKQKIGEVLIPEQFKSYFRYVKSNGEIWVVEPKRIKLTQEEKAERLALKIAKNKKKIALRSHARITMVDCRRKARKNPTVENAKAYQDSIKEYEKVMRETK